MKRPLLLMITLAAMLFTSDAMAQHRVVRHGGATTVSTTRTVHPSRTVTTSRTTTTTYSNRRVVHRHPTVVHHGPTVVHHRYAPAPRVVHHYPAPQPQVVVVHQPAPQPQVIVVEQPAPQPTVVYPAPATDDCDRGDFDNRYDRGVRARNRGRIHTRGHQI